MSGDKKIVIRNDFIGKRVKFEEKLQNFAKTARGDLIILGDLNNHDEKKAGETKLNSMFLKNVSDLKLNSMFF